MPLLPKHRFNPNCLQRQSSSANLSLIFFILLLIFLLIRMGHQKCRIAAVVEVVAAEGMRTITG